MLRKVKFLLLMLPLFLQADFAVKSLQEMKNQRVIRQQYEQSCGASSVATILNLLDNAKFSELDILKIMSEKELFTDMVSFAELENALNKLNYENKSYAISRQILENLINVPILVKIEDDPRFPHFVIIINHKGNYLQILDPSYGEYISSKAQFYSVWDRTNKGGYALIIAPKSTLKNYELNLPKSLNFDFGGF